MQTNFLLGSLQISPEAKLVLRRLPYDLVARHALNEYGLITKAERRRNELSMKTIGPIRSRYKADPTSGKRKYVIVETDGTWGSTTIYIE